MTDPGPPQQPVINVTIHADSPESRERVAKAIDDNAEALRVLVHQNPIPGSWDDLKAIQREAIERAARSGDGDV